MTSEESFCNLIGMIPGVGVPKNLALAGPERAASSLFTIASRPPSGHAEELGRGWGGSYDHLASADGVVSSRISPRCRGSRPVRCCTSAVTRSQRCSRMEANMLV